MNEALVRHCATVASSTLLLAGGLFAEETPDRLAPATGARLASCGRLPTEFSYPHTTLTSAEAEPSGSLQWGGRPIDSHCRVRGEMFRRTSPQDGKSYAIGFEMRLPNDWNGRFFYQANGGIDGAVATALGGGGPVPSPALQQGFAVISSDAGHTDGNDPSFGVDYQARLDYGYQAVAKLTPLAKALIAAAYGKGPDRSYIGGCSNGGRHTFVAMTRSAPSGTRRWRRAPLISGARSPPPSVLPWPGRCWPGATRWTAPATGSFRTPLPARRPSTSTVTCPPAREHVTVAACRGPRKP
jgi:feruloyl esterase